MFTEKINNALKEQGRTKAWLATKLGIRRTSLSTKLKNEAFSVSDKFYIASLLDIKLEE